MNEWVKILKVINFYKTMLKYILALEHIKSHLIVHPCYVMHNYDNQVFTLHVNT